MQTLFRYRRSIDSPKFPYLEDKIDSEGKHHIGKFTIGNNLLLFVKGIKKFDKNDRSTFHYWFAHWCAYQMTALNLNVWKPKFLLHDIEKPWLKFFMKYKKVQTIHRKIANHHLEYGLIHGWNKVDWLALVIDWECCHLTKMQEFRDARETLDMMLKKDKWKPYSNIIKENVERILNILYL